MKTLVTTWLAVFTIAMLAAAPGARADVVTDANAAAAAIASKLPGTPPAVRAMAITQVSVFDAVTAITGRYPALRAKVTAPPGASVDAAVAAATRTALSKLVPAQQAAIDAYYEAALKTLADGPAKAAGVAVGEQAATAVVAACANDGAMAPQTYRPHTTPGVYVPTVLPAVPHWGKRTPVAPDPRRPVPAGPAAEPHQRHLEARLRGDQGGRRQGRARAARRSRRRSRSSGRRPRPTSTGPSRARWRR